MGELEQLQEVLESRGVSAHVHAADPGDCAAPGLCLQPGDGFTAIVVSADGGSRLYVDPMTAWGVVDALAEDVDAGRVWAELAEIDHGQ